MHENILFRTFISIQSCSVALEDDEGLTGFKDGNVRCVRGGRGVINFSNEFVNAPRLPALPSVHPSVRPFVRPTVRLSNPHGVLQAFSFRLSQLDVVDLFTRGAVFPHMLKVGGHEEEAGYDTPELTKARAKV